MMPRRTARVVSSLVSIAGRPPVDLVGSLDQLRSDCAGLVRAWTSVGVNLPGQRRDVQQNPRPRIFGLVVGQHDTDRQILTADSLPRRGRVLGGVVLVVPHRAGAPRKAAAMAVDCGGHRVAHPSTSSAAMTRKSARRRAVSLLMASSQKPPSTDSPGANTGSLVPSSIRPSSCWTPCAHTLMESPML